MPAMVAISSLNFIACGRILATTMCFQPSQHLAATPTFSVLMPPHTLKLKDDFG